MEQKAVELLAVLKNSNLSIDAKVTHVLGLKSDIKQRNVPEGAVPPIFECLRLSIASHHFALLTAGFSTLGHFLKRLFIQELHNLVSLFAKDLISCLLDRLGDHKDRIRALAAQALTDIWPAAAPLVEHAVFELGLSSRNPRTKESSLIMLSTMVTQFDLSFKQYVPNIVTALEDADHYVRESAKKVALELFTNAPPYAKTDLKRQMAEKNVRKAIMNEVLGGIGLEPEPSTRPPSTRPPTVRPPSARPPSRGDIVRRPPSRGDVLHRPPSRGDALYRPPSRANALQRPHSRVDTYTSHAHPISDGTHSAPIRTGPTPVDNNSTPTLNHSAQAGAGPAPDVSNTGPVLTRPLSVVSTHADQTIEDSIDSASVILRPVPMRPNTTTGNTDKAPRMANASVDRRSTPTTPRHNSHEVDDSVQPRDLASAREFEQLVREMLPCFEGKEDETNWQKREKSVIMLRRITHGNAPHDFTQAYLTGIKTLFDAIFKVANSLRTTMQTTGLQMLQSLARVNQTRLDPMIDIILNNAMKLCGNAKKITSQNGNSTVATLLENVTRNTRVLSHITSAAASTNNNLRLYSAEWLRIVINGQAKHKTTPDGLVNIAQCIKNGVADARPENREAYRLTYWDFHRVWPDRARQVLNDILPKHRAMIEKDAANPVHDPFASSSSSSTTGLFSSTPGRPTAKGAVATKGKPSIAAAKSLPPPTTAAQSAPSDTTRTNRPRKKLRSAAPGTPTSSLSSAPMRPGASKPRPAQLESARPATTTGFHSKHTESPHRGSPARISVAQPSTPPTRSLGATRPRQKSDPLQDASPTKMGRRSIEELPGTSTQPFGTISIPKKRTNNSEGETSETSERKSDENTAPKKGFTDTAVHESPRVGSVSEALQSANWPDVDFKEVLKTEEYKNGKVSFDGKSVSESELEVDVSERMPTNAHKDWQGDIRTSYPDVAFVAGQLQEEQDSPQVLWSKAVEIPGVPPAKAISPVSSTVDPQWNIDLSGGKEMDEEATSRRASIEALTRRTSLTLPEWPETDHTPILQPGGTSPLRLDDGMSENKDVDVMSDKKSDDEMLDKKADDDSGMRFEDGTPDAQASRARRPSSDLPKESEVTPTKRDNSLRSQDPVQAREMLAKGIERIRARDMDMTGYRKLQGLIECHNSLFTNQEQYNFMLVALLDELVTQEPPSARVLPFGSVWDFKTQVLYTVKYMFVHVKTYFSGHYPEAVLKLLEAQKPYEISRHLVKITDQLIDDIVDVSEPSAVINALISELPIVNDDPGHRILRKGFEIIGHALVLMNEEKRKLPGDTLERIGELATNSLKLPSMGVKRRIIAMCVELRVMVADEDQYWKILGGTEKGVHGLLFYYKSKHRAE